MAAHGGGAWKVAYADFVTAMMAFFLVMWICSQDQKVKRAVADYFGDPLAAKQGTSRSPHRTGAVMNALTTGSVPDNEKVALGKGRTSYSIKLAKGPSTKLVSDWFHNDTKRLEYWREQAQRYREEVAASKRAKDKVEADDLVVEKLARQMREEVKRGLPPQVQGVYRDLLTEIMSEVNWTEIAEDIVGGS